MTLDVVVATLHDAPFRPSPQDIDELAAVVRIRRYGSDDVITWFDRPVVGLHSQTAPRRLADVLYAHAYSLGRAVPMAPEPAPTTRLRPLRPFSPDNRLVAISPGWTVIRRSGQMVTLTRSGEPTLTVPSALVEASTAHPVVGVSISPYSESRLPGFASVVHGPPLNRTRMTRVYLNTTFDSIEDVSEQLVRALLDGGTRRFVLKWLMSVQHDPRADSTVLYVDRARAVAVVNAIQALTLSLGPATPMFAWRVSAGLAIAADPGSELSFGQHACDAAARELIARLNTARPRRCTDPRYPLRARTPKDTDRPPLLETPRTLHQDREQSTLYLVRQARILKDEAIWDGTRAGWLTCPPTGGHGELVAAGADVYSGAPGPLLVLAHATRLLVSDEFRELARASANDVAVRCEEMSSEGFHCGLAGTAAVLAEAAVVAADPALLRSAEQLWETARARWRRASNAWDLTHGHAGFALGMSLASRLLGRRSPVEWEGALERMIEIRGARRSGWRCAVGNSRRALSGLAHGCFGAALALHNGAEQAGFERWNRVVVETLDFGLAQRCRSNGRWLDRRVNGYEEASSWCHGAAGIGLVCATLATDIPLARRAADDAANQLAQWLDHDDRRSSSLCHGRFGAILCLSQLGRQLERSELVAHADAACRQTMSPTERLSSSPPDRSLMTGSSGVTLGWYLAAHGLEPPLALSLRATIAERGRMP